MISGPSGRVHSSQKPLLSTLDTPNYPQNYKALATYLFRKRLFLDMLKSWTLNISAKTRAEESWRFALYVFGMLEFGINLYQKNMKLKFANFQLHELEIELTFALVFGLFIC